MVGQRLLGVLTLCQICGLLSARPAAADFSKIYEKFKERCHSNSANYISDKNIVKCNLTFEGSCWPETAAGSTVVQRCPFLFFRPENNISRRCDENGHWEKINTTLCHPLNEKEATEVGQRIDNTNSTPEKERINGLHLVYVIFNWISLAFMVPSFILICVLIGPQNERFNIHKNLILSYIMRIITFFAFHYSENNSTEACNVLWVLNRYFAVSEVTWMLMEAVFLLRKLVYPLDSESYYIFYFIFGWGFSGVLTFCVYLPFVRFVVARQFESCWINHGDTVFMLVLYVPMTIMLLVNLAIMAFVVCTTVRKLKDSRTPQLIVLKKAMKATIVLLPTLGVIYLLIFYIPPGNTGYDYFVRVIYPMQGILVCIFLVLLSYDVHNAARVRWRAFRHSADPGRYGVQPERTQADDGRSGDNREGAHHRRPPGDGPSGELPTTDNNASTDATRSLSSSTVPNTPASITGSSRATLHSAGQRTSTASLLSRSSDFLKRRLGKVEPEIPRPITIDVGCHSNQESASAVFVHSSADGKPIQAWRPPELPEKDTMPSNESLSNPFCESSAIENKAYLSRSETDLKGATTRGAINRSVTSLCGPDSSPKLPQGRATFIDPTDTSAEEAESDFGGLKPAKQAVNRSATSLDSIDSCKARQILLDETLFTDKTDNSTRETETGASGTNEDVNQSAASGRSCKESRDPLARTDTLSTDETNAKQTDSSSSHTPLPHQLSSVEGNRAEEGAGETPEGGQFSYSAKWLFGGGEAAGQSEISAPPSRERNSRSPDTTVWERIRARNKEWRKRKISAQPIRTPEVPLETMQRRHSEMLQEPEEYRAAWIRRIMGRQAFEDHDESSA